SRRCYRPGRLDIVKNIFEKLIVRMVYPTHDYSIYPICRNIRLNNHILYYTRSDLDPPAPKQACLPPVGWEIYSNVSSIYTFNQRSWKESYHMGHYSRF